MKSLKNSLTFGMALTLSSFAQTVDPAWVRLTENASYPARLNTATIVFQNRLWVIGGSNHGGAPLRDIWSSSDGKAWEKVTGEVPFLPRQSHTALVYNDKLWIIAGSTPRETPVYYSRSDVWNSTDGKTWTKITDSAAFVPRANHASAVFAGKMWVLGGTDTRGLAKDYGDAWSSEDGVTWTQANPAAFSPRAFHKAVVHSNKLWVLGGVNRNGQLKDIVSTSDGSAWSPVSGISGFNPVDHFFRMGAYSGKIWVQTGFTYLNTSDMTSWATVTRNGPHGYLGLHELGGKLFVLGSLATKENKIIHEVWSYPAQ